MKLRTLTLVVAVASLASCAHAEELTGAEHRSAASRAEQDAATERGEYDPAALAHTRTTRDPEAGLSVDTTYNPTAVHLAEADKLMQRAFEHLTYADRLEKTEELACADVPLAERSSCPLLAPYVTAVREVAEGVTLQLKATAPARRIAAQLRCHLAFARANDFERVPCPLFIKGVSITVRSGQRIDVFSEDKKAAAEVRREARRMLGEEIVAGR